MVVINDVHISSRRISGTTISSAEALRQFTLTSLEEFLSTVQEDLLIAGDLFDGFNISNTDLLATYKIFDRWLARGFRLVALRGNHDCSNNSALISSFDLLGALLGDRALFVTQPMLLDNMYLLPHARNSDEFSLWLSRVPECKYAIIHANYDNHFATQSDHSLNVSEEQAKAMPVEKLVFAHEHAPRTALRGKVFILGVQFPTSVSDCLSKSDLHAHRLGDTIEKLKTWDAANYAELDWQNLIPSDAQFIRITGKATSEQGADVADAVAKYRRASTAFIVSSAVKVGEDRQGETVAQTLEDLRGVNVMELLREYVTPEEMTILETLN